MVGNDHQTALKKDINNLKILAYEHSSTYSSSHSYYRVSQKKKKYGVADYRYFKNGNTQQSNTFSHNKYKFHLGVSTPYVKCNKSYELNKWYKICKEWFVQCVYLLN